MKKNVLLLLLVCGFSFADDCYRSELAEWKDVPTVYGKNVGSDDKPELRFSFAAENHCKVYYRKFLENGNGDSRAVAVVKNTPTDEGRILWAWYSTKKGVPDSAYVDNEGNFFAAEGLGKNGIRPPTDLKPPKSGSKVSTAASNSTRTLSAWDVENSVLAPLTFGEVMFNESKMLYSVAKKSGKDDKILLVGLYDVDYIYEAGFKRFFYASDEDHNNEMGVKEMKLVLGLLGRRVLKDTSFRAYDLMKNPKFTKKLAKDIDKVLKDVAGLQTTGKSRSRPKADGGFNLDYAEKKENKENEELACLLCGGGGITTREKGSVKTPSERDIDMGAGGGSRSAADIMKVVRQRTPGLRHIYNKFLKKKPGFQGKVTLKFTIAPGGEIISISIASSTTGYGEFDDEIKNAVSRWKFSKVKSGNTTVTIPFTFSE